MSLENDETHERGKSGLGSWGGMLALLFGGFASAGIAFGGVKMDLQTIPLNDKRLELRFFKDKAEAQAAQGSVGQESRLGWETEVTLTQDTLKVVGYVIHFGPKPIQLFLDGFGMGVQFTPELKHRGVSLPPAPPRPFVVKLPARSRLALDRVFDLRDYVYSKGQKISVEVFLYDLFGKEIGFESKGVSLP